jgi:hypothetical protein
MGLFSRRVATAACAFALVALVLAGVRVGFDRSQSGGEPAGGQRAGAVAARTAADVTSALTGYDVATADGRVFSFGGAPADGSMAGHSLADPIVGMAADPSTGGYWLVAADGGIFTFATPFHGSMGGHHLNSPIVGMAADPATGGYWLVAADGGIFTFTAPFRGSMGGQHLNSPIVGMAADPATGGYWLVAADGGIFTFTAPFHGSMGGQHLTSPVTGMAGTSDGGGYWLVAADGGVFAFGDATYSGSEGAPPGSQIVGITATKAKTSPGSTKTAVGTAGSATGGSTTGGTSAGLAGTGGTGTTGGTTGTSGGTTGTSGGTTGTTGTTGTAPTGICGSAALDGPATPPAGAVTLPAGNDSSFTATWELSADTTYWLAPGVHTLGTGEFAQFQPDAGDTFIGAPGAVVTGQNQNQSAFDSTYPNVTVKYLTIKHFTGGDGQMVVNHGGAADWTVEYDTVEQNGGAGVGLATGSVVDDNCLTANQEYGFASFGNSTDVTLSGNEISFNDATGTYDHGKDPTGPDTCGCSGGGKFWDTTNAVVTDNVVVTNGNVGIWVDTDNAGFDISNNYIAHNYAEGIIYEISYNALISDNTFVGNALGAGPSLGFPDSAVYISESGGDSRVHTDYAGELDIEDNTFTNNWGGVVLWANSNRHCGDGYDQYCTLVTPSTYTLASCPAHLSGAKATQSPDYYDNCLWKTQNVDVSHNTFSFNPSVVGAACQRSADCGYNGLFSQYGTTTPWKAFTVPLHISDDQNNHFSDNTYAGPWKFQAFTLGQVVTWTQWTNGFQYPFTGLHFNAQDAGSTYDATPPA